MLSGETTIRVRYAETDRMGLLHHANYLVYFEQARTDLLRTLGVTYKEMEDQGFFLVISRIEIKYRRPVHYDDLITIRTTESKVSPVRLEHEYVVFRQDNPSEIVCTGSSTLGCVNREGKIQALPDWLAEKRSKVS